MKTLKGLKLVGLVLTHCKPLNTYSITHVYRYVTEHRKGEIVLQLGYDMRCYMEFERIAESLGDAYGPNILKLWRNEEEHRIMCYFQLDKESSPYLILMSGWWKLIAER